MIDLSRKETGEMKFFHVYNEEYFEGLEKNNLINRDTGFKLQHCFPLQDNIKFNRLAAKGSKLHSLIKNGNHPFYIDRIAGGVTYHKYDFDFSLLHEYENILGKWFLGIQLHESASNRNNDWRNLGIYMNGETGPFDLEALKKNSLRSHTRLPDGTILYGFSQGTPEEYAPMRKAVTVNEYINEIETMYNKYMRQADGYILPCDSYYLFTNMQNRLGMRTFMPEVGCQIPLMRLAVSLTRGMASLHNKLWGTYYETWIYSSGKHSMPCYNTDPGNEWYLTQESHKDDFTSFGENGGSSRYLQRRIYYYTLMSGADYMAEEWGLNCSYRSMKTFELSPYGEAKKEFIDFTQKYRDIKAVIPFAIVLPRKYECVEITGSAQPYQIGVYRDMYMQHIMNEDEKKLVNHVEDVLKLSFARDPDKIFGNEGHTLTNSRFGDLFDIIYEDADEAELKKYSALIDASTDNAFACSHSDLKVFTSDDLDRLAHDIENESKQILPCYADSLHWILSTNEEGRRFISVFNNEGNDRTIEYGDKLAKEADASVNITFKESVNLKCIKCGTAGMTINKKDDCHYVVDIPAAGFAIFEY